MTGMFHDGSRTLQTRFDTRRIADRIDEVLVHDSIRERDRAASIDELDPLVADYPQAQFVVRVEVRELFPNCPRYIHRRRLVARSEYVPKPGCETPVPQWKRAGWARDHLPAADPART